MTTLKRDKVTEIATMPVEISEKTAALASYDRNNKNISRIYEFGYTVDKTGNNYHGDNYMRSKREASMFWCIVPFAFSFLKIFLKYCHYWGD